MFFRISHLHDRPTEGAMQACHHVHAAGLMPNDMNRFLHSNAREVLFVI
jgi:hypothetical protein